LGGWPRDWVGGGAAVGSSPRRPSPFSSRLGDEAAGRPVDWVIETGFGPVELGEDSPMLRSSTKNV
jgi:hypothetical protein